MAGFYMADGGVASRCGR